MPISAGMSKWQTCGGEYRPKVRICGGSGIRPGLSCVMEIEFGTPRGLERYAWEDFPQ